jgi:hypothetical protein
LSEARTKQKLPQEAPQLRTSGLILVMGVDIYEWVGVCVCVLEGGAVARIGCGDTWKGKGG